MLPFLHDRVAKLTSCLADANRVLRTNDHTFSVQAREQAETYLDSAAATFRGLGLLSAENEVLTLRAQLQTAKSGLHPSSLERGDRRALVGAVLRVGLIVTSELVRTHLEKMAGALDEGRSILRDATIEAISDGQLDRALLTVTDEAAVQRCWLALSSVSAQHRRVVRLQASLHPTDIGLLLLEVLDPFQ